MEKFGIFELLDTLSALLLPESAPSAPSAPPSPPEKAPSTRDAAFAPPAYAKEETPPPPEPAANALSSFLAKHEEAAKRADGKNRPTAPKNRGV